MQDVYKRQVPDIITVSIPSFSLRIFMQLPPCTYVIQSFNLLFPFSFSSLTVPSKTVVITQFTPRMCPSPGSFPLFIIVRNVPLPFVLFDMFSIDNFINQSYSLHISPNPLFYLLLYCPKFTSKIIICSDDQISLKT